MSCDEQGLEEVEVKCGYCEGNRGRLLFIA